MRKKDICKNIERRIFVLGGLCCSATIGVVCRFFDLQILKGQKYWDLAYKNRVKIFLESKARGDILDCSGVKIATNKIFYNVMCNPQEIVHLDNTLGLLSEILQLSAQEREYFLKNAKGSKKFIIKSLSDWSKISALEFKSDKLPALYIIQEYRRFYPFANAISHIVGYTKYCAQKDAQKGQLGIESLYDCVLVKKPDVVKKQVDARGRITKELERQSFGSEGDAKTCLCADLCNFLYQLLQNKKGSASVIEVATGQIKAIVNHPSYDNNIFSQNISQQQWDILTNNDANPLLNRALSSLFQPGSTFKTIAAIAILEGGIAGKNTTVMCKGHVKIGDRIFRCWKRSGHGLLDAKGAISESCNVYFYTLGARLKIEDIVKIAQKFGFGQKCLNGFTEEKSGILPTDAWKREKLGDKWYIGDTINAAVGHGYISVTPFQLCLAAARIASGKMVIPTFDLSQDCNFASIDINQENLSVIQSGILDAFEMPNGTSYQFASKLQKIAGKTGTAQILNTENKKFAKECDHSLFIGYNLAPSKQYAVSVVLENAGGGKNAAKIAVDILDYLHKKTRGI